MTPLQMLRNALSTGVTLTMYKLDDGYHIEVSETNQNGVTVEWEVVNGKLDQALHKLRRELLAMEQMK